MQTSSKNILVSLMGAIALGLLVLTVILTLNQPASLTTVVVKPNTWHGITPGQTTLSEVLQLLGSPEAEWDEDNYHVLNYQTHRELLWKEVFVWLRTDDSKPVVVGVLRLIPYFDKGYVSLADMKTLKQVVILYGRPEKVTWAKYTETRHLIWATQGIAMNAGANIEDTIDGDFHIGQVVTFEPSSVQDYLKNATYWPWPKQYGSGFSTQNPYPPNPYAHTRDIYPEDPYQWEQLLSP